jgi:penicillin amidase
MKKAVRGALIAAGSVACLGIILVGAWLVLTRMSFPRTSGTERLEGLSAPVIVQRDPYGVPHIYARSSKDLFLAQGYVHAQDRFWQMELSRRIGAGRLSELFGKSQLQTDIFLRTLGITRVAQREYDEADPGLKGILEAYAAGVNAYIHNRSPARLGLEFTVLNLTGVKTRIEPWTPVNTLAWGKMMAWSGDGCWTDEITTMRLLHTMGIPGIRGLFTPYRSEMPFAVTDRESGSAQGAPLFGGDWGFGSNGWVIGGSRSASGKPILANDMHLDVQIPSIWYEVGLHGVDENGRAGRTKDCPFDLYGYSLPGAPGVVSGHNDRISWGMTYLHGDVQDLYLEKINPRNPDQYMVDGAWKDMELIYEEIPVRKANEPYRLRVRATRHGPLISDHGEQAALNGFMSPPDAAFPEGVELTAVSLQWAALQPSNVVRAELLLDQAESYAQFREALRSWYAPSLNFIYADVDGNIAYQCAGRIPVRAKGLGEAPMPGWTSQFEWRGFIPFDELPRSLNPSKGYIVTANNPPEGKSYPHFLGTGLDYGYRARRIVEMIEAHTTPFRVTDVQQMQADTLNYTAREICAALKGLDLRPTALEKRIADQKNQDLTARQKQDFQKKEAETLTRMETARQMLLGWDGRMSGDSAAAALYACVWQRLVTEIFRDQYPEAEWPMTASGRAENAVHFLLQDPSAALWDDITTPARETRDEILVRSFRRGYSSLVDAEGNDPRKWRWDKIHTITFVNQTLGKSGVAPLEKIFNRGPFPVPSGPTEVNAEAWDRKRPFEVTLYPSMRFIVDMGSLSHALSVLPTGQSGHPGNRHYDDFIRLWQKVEYHPALWDRADIERASRSKLILTPR